VSFGNERATRHLQVLGCAGLIAAESGERGNDAVALGLLGVIRDGWPSQRSGRVALFGAGVLLRGPGVEEG